MLATTFLIFKTVVAIGIISGIEFALFFVMVKFATNEQLSNLWQSFYKTYLEALFFAALSMGILMFLKVKSGIQDGTTTLAMFEQSYALILFLALVLTCSMHYELFAKNKYKYSFFGLICLIVFLLLYRF